MNKEIKFSIIIPHYDPQKKMVQYLKNCLESIKKNSLKYSYEIVLIDSIKSYSQNVNEGLRQAKGDFFVLLNNDTEIKDTEWLDKLYTKDKISAWKLVNSAVPEVLKLVPDASCWGMSRKVFNTLGRLDERFSEGYGFEDTDYWMRAKKVEIEFKNSMVKLIHYNNKTFSSYFPNEFIFQYSHNENLFLKKYKLI